MSATARLALYVLLFLSGSAGLAYQTIWTQTFTVALGHELPSLLAVVAAFFSGLSLGAWSLGARIGRSTYPQRWYAAFELLIAAWAVVGIYLLPHLADYAATALGVQPLPIVQWSAAFLLPFVALLPATFAMGATLPAMEQVLSRRTAHGQVVGGTYAANTAGAMIGVVVSVFLLLPTLGQQGTLLLFAAVNVVCAVGAISLGGGRSVPIAATPSQPPPTLDARPLAWLLFATGLLGIGYEVLAVRVMSQVFEGTLYSFATALVVYLAASSAGAGVFQRYAAQMAAPAWLSRLLLGLAYSCLVGMFVLYGARDLYRTLRLTVGDSALAVFVSELTLALSVYLLPSFLMGMTFALLTQRARQVRGDIGHALGVNTLGGALAPALFAVLLLPLIGAKWSFGLLAFTYLVLLPLPSKTEGAIGWWPR
ncbi:MAG: fused MFS/spermidine synthase, partial [Pseudomonadota bacterium]